MTQSTSAPPHVLAAEPAWSIRAARLEDAPQLHRDCLPQHDQSRIAWLVRSAVEAADRHRGQALVAEASDGHVIGFGRITRWLRGAEISDLVVNPGWRGKGIGTALVQRLIQLGAEMGAQYVEIGVAAANRRAYRLYRRLGFERARLRCIDLGNGPETVVYLRHLLNPRN